MPGAVHIFAGWEIEFNRVYLKRGLEKFEQHSAFLRFLIDEQYPVTVDYMRQLAGEGPDLDPSVGSMFVFEPNPSGRDNREIPPGVASVYWAKVTQREGNKAAGGTIIDGGLSLDELRVKYPELSARAEQESKG